MGELVRAGDIAAGVDVRIERLQIVVRLYRARSGERDAELFKPVARRVRDAPERAEQCIELEAHLAAVVLTDERAAGLYADGAMRGTHVDAFGGEALAHQLGRIRVLARQQPRQHFDLGYVRAKAREGLRQLTADRAAPEHDEPARQLAQFPHRVGGEHPGLLDPRDARHERPRARGDDDGARRQR